MGREIVLGIDVGTSAVKTVIAEKRKGDDCLYILGTGISPGHGLRKGIIINQHDVAVAIKNSVKQAGKTTDVKLKQAFVSVGGIGVEGMRSKGSIVVSRADHEITENDLKRAINQSQTQLNRNSSSYLLNRDILHLFPISYKIDDETIIGNPVGLKGEKLEVETLFITSTSQHLNSLVKSMDLAGIAIEDIVADSWAMSSALLKQKEKEVGCLLINIGGDTSSLIVFEEGGPISTEIFPIGSNHITYDIARGFQVLLDEAENLKISYGPDISLKRKLNTIIEPRLSDIFELVENHLGKIKRAKLLPAGIILTGGGANLAGIEEIAKNSLKLPVQLSQVNWNMDSKTNLNNPLWTVALGLCIIGLDGKNNSIMMPEGIGQKAKKNLLNLFKNFLP
jgi:cell division protein FtsA